MRWLKANPHEFVGLASPAFGSLTSPTDCNGARAMWAPTDRNLYRLLTDWGGVIAGMLALAAAWWTVRATRSTARDQIVAARDDADKQIAAARKEADDVVAAAREQTKVTAEQTATTVRLERERALSEARAYRVMLEAAMARVLAEAAWAKAWAKEKHPAILTQSQGASAEALVVRQCITKGAFTELRAACVRQGGPLTGEFLDLERQIDSFAMQGEDKVINAGTLVRWGKHAGLGDQLDWI